MSASGGFLFTTMGRTATARAAVLALVLATASAQEGEPIHLDLARLDGELVALTGIAPRAGWEHMGRAASGSLVLESVRIGQGALRRVGERRVVEYGGDGGNPFFLEIAVARGVSDGELVVAHLGGQGPAYLDLWADGKHLVRTRSVAAPYEAAMFPGDGWLPLADRPGARTEFTNLGGVTLDRDDTRLVAYVSGLERGARMSYVLAVSVDDMELDVVPNGRIVARGSGPRLGRDAKGRLWMLTRDAAEGISTPAALRLSTRDVDGTWAAVPSPLAGLRASADYDMAVGDGRLYVSAWHYPDYRGGNLQRGEPVEIGLWSLDLSSGEWSRVTPPGGFDPAGPVRRYSRSIRLFESGGSSSPGLRGPLMGYETVDGELEAAHLGSLERVALE